MPFISDCECRLPIWDKDAIDEFDECNKKFKCCYSCFSKSQLTFGHVSRNCKFSDGRYITNDPSGDAAINKCCTGVLNCACPC